MNTIFYESRTTILIADSDDETRSLIKAVLTWKGFQVLEASDGAEAYDLALANQPALLFIDLKLPVLSGISVVRKLRAAGVLHIPIIATSPTAQPAQHRVALASGCVACIEKPIEPDQLDELLDRFLPGEQALVVSASIH
jgi:CheY-like chemotaxis protein